MEIKLLFLLIPIFLTSCIPSNQAEQNQSEHKEEYQYHIVYRVYYSPNHVREYEKTNNSGFYADSREGTNYIRERDFSNTTLISTSATIEVVSLEKIKIN